MAYKPSKEETYALLGGLNTKVSAYDNDKTEFRALVNLNFRVPGALSKREGSTLALGATVLGRITGLYEFNKLDGSSYLIATANTNAYKVDTSFNAFNTGLTDGAVFDFVTYVDRLFAANGAQFFKYDGTNTTAYSLPPGATGSWGITAIGGGSLTAAGGNFYAAYGYINDRGYIGPASNPLVIALNGISYNSIGYYGLTSPSGFGITAIALYRSEVNGTDLFGSTNIPAISTDFIDTNTTLSEVPGNDNLYFTLAPKYLELYNNQLFLGGFSGQLSSFYWSQIGEPEAIPPEFTAEVRTNDGDRLSGLKAYNGVLMIGKKKSIHRLTGDNPNNFNLTEISDQYGVLSNRTMIVWQDILWFLDSEGIVQFNGANIGNVSDKIEPIIRRMNRSAAEENAVAVHYKKLNEVWMSFPVDGSTTNNIVVVYDYITRDWTTYEGLFFSSVAVVQHGLSAPTVFYGGYTGSISNFSDTIYGDNGAAITCIIGTHYLAQRGQSTENLYRQFYLDVDPVVGASQPIAVDFRTNYGSSIQLSRSIYQSQYQTRLDFGLPARSIQATMTHVSASLPIKINGFTFVGRFQRGV